MTKVTNISVIPDATQNFVEVYKRRRKDKNFGKLEKRLILALILFITLFVIFFVLFIMAEHFYHELEKQKVCTSKECIESSMTLLQSIDFSQDPCEDFYKFACGKFESDHPLLDSYLHNSWFVEKENHLNRLLLDILKSPISKEDLKAVRQTKEFYQSCTNRSELNSIGLKPLYEVLELLELPKSVPNNLTTENFSIGRTLALAQLHLSQDIIVALGISKGQFNTSFDSGNNVTILKVSPGLNGINVFDVWKRDNDIFNLKNFQKFRRKPNGRDRASNENQSSKQIIRATIKFISSIIKEINNDLDIDLDITNDYNSSYFTTTAYKIMTFSSELIKDVESNGTDADNATTPEQMTFSSLQTLLDTESKNSLPSNKDLPEDMCCPQERDLLDLFWADSVGQLGQISSVFFRDCPKCSDHNRNHFAFTFHMREVLIDWREYISTLFKNSSKTYDVDADPIMVENLEYFKYISRILGEAKPETIQRHIWWKIVEQYAKHTTSDMRAIYIRYYHALYGESATASRSHVCTNLMKSTMNVALSHEMSRFNNFSTATKKVNEMLKDIGKAFEMLVRSMKWMDRETKAITLDKARSVSNEIGYATWITDSKKVDEYYEKLDLKKSEFLMNLRRISEWEVQNVIMLIGPEKENSSKNSAWFVNPLQVNAYYSREDNSIIIPPGILQTPFYFRGLESLNYGAIGTILGHELTHGFDTEGKNYNKFGKRQENWWSTDITTKYEAKAKCFVKQYENFTLYENNKVNGTLTLAENIADNGGVRESFKAYQLYKKRHGDELKLPAFENFTHEQLLFLSYANIWCEASVPKYYALSQDSHSPQRVRVLATLQNLKEFSKAFKCPKNSFMNPVNKCIIW